MNEDERLAKKNRRIAIVGLFFLALIVAAIVVVLNFDKLQGQAAHRISTDKTELQQARYNHQKRKPSYNMRKVNPISPSSLAHAWRVRRDYRAVGQIAIPDKNILLNIFRGVGNDELALGAGTFRADQKMGKNNYPLAGHNMDDAQSYFSPLYTAKVNGTLSNGTVIYLTDFTKVYFYKITSSQFIGVYNLNLAFNRKKFVNHPVISLFTCDYTGQGRLFIRGKLTGSQSLKSATKYVRQVFEY
ncbi:class A sortase (plasmid) [Lactobacillus sp. ESL0731]|uniref:class A sortase n=1 Tax=unclassified Lactobacillus TaxID=2620435 RepID=UPI0023F7AE60|nr:MULTISPECIES: class A sortase [unclassified Lactobacillus]WEV52086.1 class A sortase [Lactobacillus sp. ESL0700]WEV63223.1 class A sortase [Lactobacillus sp. ESL0731]